MAVEHILLFEWNEDVSDEQVQECLAELHALKDAIPGIQSIKTGRNFSDLAGGTDHAAILTMDDVAALKAYAPHPIHMAFVKMVKPMMKNLVVVDFEV